MKKSYVLIGLFFVFIILITIIGSIFVTGNKMIDEDRDILLVQSNKELYFNVYGYSVDNPNVIVNPYGNSPLTALIMFETNNYSEVEVTIKGKDDSGDINYTFSKNKYHMIPVYGLYADYDNTIIIESEGIEKIIYIKTDKLPEDFIFVNDKNKTNFMFYTGNYPYAIDDQDEVRWYLNSNYFGNITFMDNSNIIIGSDRYTEDGNTISFYRMNLLGKIYNEYLLQDDYYGYNTLYGGNVLILSDKLLLIDVQTGEIISEYIQNDGYDYLDVQDNDIILRKDGIFYKLVDNSLEEINYSVFNKKYSFYNNTTNYNIVPSNRFGNLRETFTSDKKIALVNYGRLDTLENIEITLEVNRIKVTNNNDNSIYLILDKFMDKRIYEVDDVKYINTINLNGKYTIYLKIDDQIYKTDYYIEV